MHRRLAPIPRGGGAREFQLLHPGSADRGERPLVGFAADAARREPPTSPVPVGGIVLGARVIVRSGTGLGDVAVIWRDYG